MYEDKEELNGKTRRQIYFSWLNERLILPRLKADPNTAVATAKSLNNVFDEHTRLEFENDDDAIASRKLNASLFLDLPKQIATELKSDKSTLDWLGVSIDKYFILGKVRFLSKEIWKAIERAVNGEPVSVSEVDSSNKFRIQREETEDGHLSLEFIEEITGKRETMAHAALGILLDDREKRVECLKNNRFWFDCDDTALNLEIEELVSLSDPRFRIERINTKIRQSVDVYYKQLQGKFDYFWEQGKNVTLGPQDLQQFPASGLLNHYRLVISVQPSREIPEILMNSADLLLQEDGPKVTIERFSHLPLKIPEAVVIKLKQLSDLELVSLFEDLIETLVSPLCKMQLVDLILRTAPENQVLLEHAKILIKNIYSEDEGDYNLFASLLRFVKEEFGYLKEIAEWSVPIKLLMIWAHAGKLFNLICPVFGNKIDFRHWLEGLHQHSSTVFGEQLEYTNDCLYPRWVSRPLLQVHGTAALWAGNKKHLLDSLGIFEEIRKAIILEGNIPYFELFRATELLNNSTNSIFGGDRANVLSSLYEEEDWKDFSDTALKKHVIEALEILQKDETESNGWLGLSITVGSSPIYEDLRNEFTSFMENLNFSALLEKDVEKGFKALAVILPQISLFDDIQKKKVESYLYELTVAVADKCNLMKKQFITDEMVNYGYRILEFALMLSIRNQEARKSGENFRRIMLELMNIWKELGSIAENAIRVTNASLPLAQTYYLPEILLNIRASKPKGISFESSLPENDENEGDLNQ